MVTISPLSDLPDYWTSWIYVYSFWRGGAGHIMKRDKNAWLISSALFTLNVAVVAVMMMVRRRRRRRRRRTTTTTTTMTMMMMMMMMMGPVALLCAWSNSWCLIVNGGRAMGQDRAMPSLQYSIKGSVSQCGENVMHVLLKRVSPMVPCVAILCASNRLYWYLYW